jgi:tetratricopeptide (TPR) repeat protein
MPAVDIQEEIRLALRHYQEGRLNEAERICTGILRVQPDNAFALHLLGVLFYGRGQYGSAINCIRESIRLDPQNPDAYNNLGSALKLDMKLDEAIQCYRKAIKLNPDRADVYFNLGNTLVMKRQLDEAITFYQEAVRINPDFAEAYNNLGNVLKEQGRLDEALECYRKTIQINPDLPDAYFNLGNIFQDKGQYDDAQASYRQSLKLRPNHVESYRNIGTALQKMGKFDEAIDYYQKAAQLTPDFSGTYYNLGVALQEKREFDKAMTYFQKTIELDPDFSDAHFSIAIIQLLRGNFREGWKGYEWRWKLKKAYARNFPQPLWDGADPSGRTVLLHAEQGFGDTIQFIRYVPLVAERGAKVVVECRKELVTLLRSVEGVRQIRSYGEQLPEFDIHCPLLSLPMIFDTLLESIPANIPYISAASDLEKKWRSRLRHDNSKLKAGLVWAGRATTKKESFRSTALDLFSPLSDIGDMTFYSLQKGHASAEAENPPKGMKLINYADEIHDFSDTAAFINCLDLVISVDTAVAHLAGALGKEVWTLLPFVPDWRWLLNREDSPWYPTMKLFRQQSSGDWGPVIIRLRQELRALI